MEIKIDKDMIIDGLGAAVVAYIAWTLLFGGEPIPVIGDLLKYAGTVTAGYIAWKFFRRT